MSNAKRSFDHASGILRPTLALASRDFLTGIEAECRRSGLADAVARRDTGFIYRWLLEGFQYQGLSDHGAATFVAAHGLPTFDQLARDVGGKPACAKLRSHWHFEGCGYRKEQQSCARPARLHRCPLPALPMRKGVLNQTAVGLYMFLRDVCDSDLVGWIDRRLAAADAGAGAARAASLRHALLEPMGTIHGVSDKVLSMTLATMLIGTDPHRERWVAAGVGMIAIDSLVHNFMHRTGLAYRLGMPHAYGRACYAPQGCASMIEALAEQIDARTLNPSHPAYFPRLIQFAIWHFCAEGGLSICNGRNIDDRWGCRQRFCPAYDACERLPLSLNA